MFCTSKTNYINLLKKISNDFARIFVIIFREADLIYDEKLDPVMRKMEVARLIASKIAYQWFSNVFSLSHFWLHEGLAILFAEEAIVKVFIIINIKQNYY